MQRGYHYYRPLGSLISVRSRTRITSWSGWLLAGLFVMIALIIYVFWSPTDLGFREYKPSRTWSHRSFDSHRSIREPSFVIRKSTGHVPYQSAFGRRSTPSIPQRQFPVTLIPTRMRRKKLSKRKKQTITNRTNGCCAHCEKFLAAWDREINHIIPVSSDLWESYDLNSVENYELLCRRCHGAETYRQRMNGELKGNRREPSN